MIFLRTFLLLFMIFLLPNIIFSSFQDDNPKEEKEDDFYSYYLKIKNNFKDESFWNNSELIKNKKKVSYDEFDEVKKNLIKQIICRSCKNSLNTKLEKMKKDENKNIADKYKNAIKDLDEIDKKLKIDLYEIKPDWFTDLDKEIFLEIKK